MDLDLQITWKHPVLTLLTSVLVLITGKINRFLIVSESTSRHFQKVKALPKNLRERL